jgi:hypothetical protein
MSTHLRPIKIKTIHKPIAKPNEYTILLKYYSSRRCPENVGPSSKNPTLNAARDATAMVAATGNILATISNI